MSALLEWTRWGTRGNDLHVAQGEFGGESGDWRIVKPHPSEPWEVWFRPSGMGTQRRRRRHGRLITTARTLAAAKEAAEGLG